MADEAQSDLLTTEASQTETTSQTKVWYSEDNKDVVERCGWKEPNDVIKSFRNVEKMSSGMAKMPTPESSAEEVRAFYQKTGCPENPEGYDVSGLPETMPDFLRNEDIENAMKTIAYEQGVSKQAFESIIRGFYEKANADLQASKAQGEQSLREQHGEKYDEVLEISNRFFDTCSPEFCELVKVAGLANHPVFINEFLAKGKQIMADTLIKGDTTEEKKEVTIKYPNSPEMYASGEDDESKEGRAYHEAKGFKY